MKLGGLNRNVKERDPVRAAIATVLVGLFILGQGVLADLEGTGGGIWHGVALVFFALAVAVRHDSDEAGLAVIGLCILLVVLTVMIGGLKMLFPWPMITAVALGRNARRPHAERPPSPLGGRGTG